MSATVQLKERKARVKIVLWTSKTLADGSHPFVVRIHKGTTRKHITTGLSLHPRYWNPKKHEIRQNYPADKRRELEAALAKWQDRFSDAASTLANNDTQHDASSIVHKVADDRSSLRQFNLLSFFDELISQFDRTGKVGNRKVYRDVRNNLQRYAGEGKDVSFDAVTINFCNGWETKMREEGLTEITLSVKFRTLRAVLNKAIASGYAKADNYPFSRNTAETGKFSVGKFDTNTTKRAISKADIRKIEQFQPEPYIGSYASLRDTTARQLLAKDLFLFSYYCGGINFVDMAALTWANVVTDLHGHQRLTYTRQKTGGKFAVRLMPFALSILERYRPAGKPMPAAYVFPILNNALHKTPMQKHNRCSKIMTQVNADLKTVGQAVGVETPLTTYVARHSFATSLRMAGQDVAVISQAMGHADEATTRIYLQELGTELIDAAYENL